MGTIHEFRHSRRPQQGHRPAGGREPGDGDGGGWGAAARGLGPLLLVLPLAAFAAVYFTGEPPTEDMGSPGAPVADNVRKHFSRCEGPVRITCVVDGDTIWLNGQKIRIADIDTPEVSEPGCPAEAAKGAQATARLEQLLNAGAFTVAPNPDGRDEDRYGRKLRVLTRNGKSIGQMLVAEGLAHEWGGGKRSWC